MKVYVFGNLDLGGDRVALEVAKKLEGKIKDLEFIYVNPNEDLPFAGKSRVVILDAVLGINKVCLLDENDLEKLTADRSVSVHDFDLGFQLKYLKKLGKIKKMTIVGLPMDKRVNYLRIQSILRKLVAQEMQGS